MRQEIDIAFALLRAALDGTDECAKLNTQHLTLNTHDWWRLFRLLQQNHVAAMTADTVAALDVPREVKIPWLAERDKAEHWHRYQKEIQQEIVNTMQKHGIETLVLKGTHTAAYYPIPELREFGDLDLFFYDKHDVADRIAEKELGVAVSNDAHHHSKYNYRGVTVESHYDFINRHYPPSNQRYEALLKELAPTPTFEILFLLRHMACHFAASRITLRDLVDWTLTCRALQDKVDWERVNTVAKDFGMEPFITTLNVIAEQRLGSDIGLAPVADVGQVPVPCHALEHDLVYGSAVADHGGDGLSRLGWKLRRWRALAWKRRLVFNDSEGALLLASLTSHAEKPHSILHKM